MAVTYNTSPVTQAASLLTYTSPSPKLTLQSNGFYSYQAHNLFLNSASPANQSITVVSGATYSIIITGATTTTLSGAATGTITAGTTNITAATTTLTFGSTSGAGTVQVTRTPADLTYLATTGSARYNLPYEWNTSGTALGIRVEPSATNLCFPCRPANGGGQWPFNLATSGGTVTGPFGGNAMILTEAASTGQHYTGDGTNQSFSLTSGTTYGIQCAVKKGTRTWCWVGGFNSGIGDKRIFFNFDTGAYGTVSSGLTTFAPISMGNGYWLIGAAYTATTNSNFSFRIGLASADNTPSYAGSTSENMIAAFAQWEVGPPTSPIETFGSTVTRAADQPNDATSDFSYSATTNTVAVTGRTASGSGTQVFWQLDDGTDNERIRIVRDSSNNMRCIVTDGGVEQANINLGAVANNTAFRVALAWAANDIAACLDGGSVSTDTGATIPTVTTLRIGYSSAGEQCNGHNAALVQVPRRVSNADLPTFGA
jgi:hypothetical protein